MQRLRQAGWVLRRVPGEAYVWAAALVALACTDPATGGLFDLCLLKRLGAAWCPGCGLGHAVAHLFRGEVAASLQAHPLAPFAVTVLLGRVAGLVRGAYRAAAESH